MTTNNNDDEKENYIKDTDPLNSKKTKPPENDPPNESSDSNVDPLQELRQNLYSEEHPQDSSKNDIFKRMTESLSNRKVPPAPKVSNGSEHVFGVRTAGGAAFEPSDRAEPETDWNRNTVILQNAPKAEPFVQGLPQTKQSDPASYDQDESVKTEGQGDISSSKVSKVRPSDPDEQDAVWKNYSLEQSVEQKPPVSVLDEKIARPQSEKKRAQSGFDRQQQVSRYISYNPKRSTWEQFKELSKIERTLIISLAVAVLGLISLIAFLFIESRQPGFGSNNRVVTELTPSPIVSPPVPVGLVLTGGWSFELGSGVMVNGVWNPTTSEWLLGTEIRRVIAIPWSKQIEAVVQSFEVGDLLELQMSNGDSYTYKVLTVSEVPVEDTSILYDIRPTLAIILMKPEAEKRWVVVAEPQ